MTFSHLGNQCQTVDNIPCSFPFEYEGYSFWTCTDLPINDVPIGSSWCATDANDKGKFKSIGQCKPIESCPKGKETQFV